MCPVRKFQALFVKTAKHPISRIFSPENPKKNGSFKVRRATVSPVHLRKKNSMRTKFTITGIIDSVKTRSEIALFLDNAYVRSPLNTK